MVEPALPTSVSSQPLQSPEEASSETPRSLGRVLAEFRNVSSLRGLGEYLKQSTGFLLGTLIAAIVLTFLIQIVPIMMIIVGSLHRHDCPVNVSIPSWLTVTGTALLIRNAFEYVYNLKTRGSQKRPLFMRCLDWFSAGFFSVWITVGAYNVYMVYGRVSYNPKDEDNYCDQVTYIFAFVSITASLVLMLLCGLCLGGCCCYACFNSSEEELVPNV